jgi:hypothetical protein
MILQRLPDGWTSPGGGMQPPAKAAEVDPMTQFPAFDPERLKSKESTLYA